MAKFAGLIFDLDGTLVDSALDFTAMRRETGCPEDMGLLEFLDQLESQIEREQASAIIHSHEMAGAERAQWMPGADDLLHSLHAKALPLGIVTRNSREVTRHTLARLQAPEIDLIAREDALPKPNPDGLLKLAQRWAIAPDQLAYIGDFRFDLEAAHQAGMRSVLYIQPKNIDYAAEAHFTFSHFEQLLEVLGIQL